eukprot:jgi/Tetstr1/425962/TSEL_016312.t1
MTHHMTHKVRRDFEWCAAVPNHSNGRSIYKPAVETAYMHVDSPGYISGWSAILNESTDARGYSYDGDRELHITYKELKVDRYVVLTIYLSELRDRHVLLHEENMGVPPYWPDRRLSEMASEAVVVFPPSPYLIAPGRLGVRAGIGPPKLQVVAFRLPLHRGPSA